jgi:hypothetical protein
MSTNSRRKLRKVKIEMGNMKAVVEAARSVLERYGYTMSFSEEIPQILEEILSALPAPTEETALAFPNLDPSTVIAKPAVPKAIPEYPDLDPLEGLERMGRMDLLAALEEDLEESAPLRTLSADEDEAPMSVEEMQRAYEAKNAQLYARVEREGIHYRDNANPEVEGRRMVAHPSVAPAAAPTTPPVRTAPPKPGPRNVQRPTAGPPEPVGPASKPSSQPGDDRFDPKTGLTIGQKRMLLERQGIVTSVPEPSGPNLLKQ